jgi:deoxyadenosine/deoxycytidine kinase
MRNISRRGRDFEKNISEDYIDALNQVYNEYFFRYQDTPLVIINTNNIDFVRNDGDLDEVINYIRQPVTGTKFFNPTTGL